ncbi:hypothetical protein [Tenacibaculum maritimum]|uniref:hypothetical protein n=1 Tax=Tenacibaculum maritimum TaxID=107401 RepID=UPI0012E64A23|nr:hypothetical protein [Tenacibaculum maritimum]CAA0149708.1 hypothetical protein FS0810_10134 [Tenacibaculum maritimum]
MNKNKAIKENLKFHLDNSFRLFNNEFSFQKAVQQELNNFENITWLPSYGVDIKSFKEDLKRELTELLNNNKLHSEIQNLIKELQNRDKKRIQENIEQQMIDNLTNIALDIPEERNNFKLNLLFLEHDYYPEACFCGFDDRNYKYKLLSGQEYLKFDYQKELFNGVGLFNYETILNEYLKYIEYLGEEKVDQINEALVASAYLEKIKKIFLLDGYLEIHLCFERINRKIREIKIPMRDEVFIFGNEHDCEELNIYVL